MSRTSLFDVYLAIFTPFFAHPTNLKGLVVFHIFHRLIHIFKDDFTKLQDNSRTKGTFFKFQEFSRTTVKFKDFSRSVGTLLDIPASDDGRWHIVPRMYRWIEWNTYQVSVWASWSMWANKIQYGFNVLSTKCLSSCGLDYMGLNARKPVFGG